MTRKFSDSRTFEGDVGLLIFAWIFRTSWPKMFFWGGVKWWKGWRDDDLNELVLLLGVLPSVPILVKIDQEM